MYFVKKTPLEKRLDLQKKLKTGKLIRFPGAYNPLVAKLIEEIGYDGIYISGAVMANDLGLPDIGLTTLTEVSYRSEQIARVTNLPSIVDADAHVQLKHLKIMEFQVATLKIKLIQKDADT